MLSVEENFRGMKLREIAKELELCMECNCSIDKFEPDPETYHNTVCRIHKRAKEIEKLLTST